MYLRKLEKEIVNEYRIQEIENYLNILKKYNFKITQLDEHCEEHTYLNFLRVDEIYGIKFDTKNNILIFSLEDCIKNLDILLREFFNFIIFKDFGDICIDERIIDSLKNLKTGIVVKINNKYKSSYNIEHIDLSKISINEYKMNIEKIFNEAFNLKEKESIIINLL